VGGLGGGWRGRFWGSRREEEGWSGKSRWLYKQPLCFVGNCKSLVHRSRKAGVSIAGRGGITDLGWSN